MDDEDIDIVEEVSSVVKSKQKHRDKLCFICEANKAEFCIKGATEDCYCKECAIDAFGDIDCLEKIN